MIVETLDRDELKFSIDRIGTTPTLRVTISDPIEHVKCSGYFCEHGLLLDAPPADEDEFLFSPSALNHLAIVADAYALGHKHGWSAGYISSKLTNSNDENAD